MTLIILQLMHVGIYATVDESLMKVGAGVEDYSTIALSQTIVKSVTGQEGVAIAPSDVKFRGQMVANTHIVVFDKDGNIMNDVDSFSGLQHLKLKKDQLSKISEQNVKTSYGLKEVYRSITFPITNKIYKNAKYAAIVVNTTQLKEANDRYVNIIISLMAIFWLVSLGASLYLAKWSQKPILESYEKQKAFVENASHELRTPLAVLQNRLETLFRKPQATVMDNSENIASSLSEVRNMRILTTNLLELARRDDGLTPKIEMMTPDFFDAIFQNYDMIAEENNKTFHYHNRVSDAFKSDKTLLKQLMTILFDNAIKYTAEDGCIEMTVLAKERQLLIRIADNGTGISEADKPKIFDRFYRVDKARTRQKGGFGLGLSLAKQIVNTLKGTITVRDNHPKGSIFEVKLTLTK